MRGFGERAHVICVALRGEIRIIFAAMQRIFGDARAQPSARSVHDRHANTESSKIDAGHDRHSFFSDVSSVDCSPQQSLLSVIPNPFAVFANGVRDLLFRNGYYFAISHRETERLAEGTTSQAAEKVFSLGGRGLSPDVKGLLSTGFSP